ncbi:MAG TPA: NADH-ubiquinone oxidoreductase-F iron-sulfur binding region domain-containing protein [Jatrophihabitans sp.]|jgi:NADH:ubiquinone oxidoreductase subunit F (NADH-binding)|nr:NADH-ubiquinone oxidoreductase-F iron-sulfur binding region domain-containing protein [Jatrophihabitans sp.]
MTALAERATTARRLETETWVVGAPRLLAGLDRAARLDLRAHLAVHGPLPAVEIDRLLSYADAVRLAGRGGAGFPLASKLRSLAEGQRHIVVNGSESEPASQKDRVLLRRAPHLMLDGALAVAQATRARRVTVAVHDAAAAASVRAAVAERPDARHVRVRKITAGFVSGEARAVVRALKGGPAKPHGRRTPDTLTGTFVSNVETFAQLAILLRIGPHRFADTGTHAEPGTTLLTVGGAVRRPGVVEIPIGTPLGIVLAAAGAPAYPQAVIVGGYHGAWIAQNSHVRLSRTGLAAAGGAFGAGVVLVLDDTTCALGELARVTGWLAAQSARQCGPCRFGLPALAADVAALVAGQRALTAAFGHVRAVEGRGACAHPDGAARFVTSGLHILQDETERHLVHGGCGRPIAGQLPIETVSTR